MCVYVCVYEYIAHHHATLQVGPLVIRRNNGSKSKSPRRATSPRLGLAVDLGKSSVIAIGSSSTSGGGGALGLPLLPAGLAHVLLDGEVADAQGAGEGRVERPGEPAGAAQDGRGGEPAQRGGDARGGPREDLPRGVVVEVDAAAGDGGGDARGGEADGEALGEGPGAVQAVDAHARAQSAHRP